MIKIFKTFGGYIEIPKIEKGCWINIVHPTTLEIQRMSDEFHLPQEIFQDILDTDERPRIEFDETWTLIILRIPIKAANNGIPFITVPLGIYMCNDFTLTLCLTNNEILPIEEALPQKGQYRQVSDVFNFILRLFLHSGTVYLKYLKEINQQTAAIEQDLEKSIKNKELNKLLKMEKCLVYFITSIKANEIVLAKLRNSKKITSEINEDLLEDAIIENKQALEMAQIYSDIQSGMMDAFASVISNNINVVMKRLTIISIVLMIPTLISSMFGMNVPNFMEESKYAFPGILLMSVVLSFFGVILLNNRRIR